MQHQKERNIRKKTNGNLMRNLQEHNIDTTGKPCKHIRNSVKTQKANKTRRHDEDAHQTTENHEGKTINKSTT